MICGYFYPYKCGINFSSFIINFHVRSITTSLTLTKIYRHKSKIIIVKLIFNFIHRNHWKNVLDCIYNDFHYLSLICGYFYPYKCGINLSSFILNFHIRSITTSLTLTKIYRHESKIIIVKLIFNFIHLNHWNNVQDCLYNDFNYLSVICSNFYPN